MLCCIKLVQKLIFYLVCFRNLVFEAALNIDKKSFSKMAVPIIIFAVWGTFMSTLLTAAIVYYGTSYFTMCTSIPFVESLAFGALISSIDPIAVLSVLNNMGMSDVDPIYVLIFGESLLNDGVAIVLFQTLVHFMDSQIVIDSEAVSLIFVDFSR
jgi:NhaP-type Na+/H+ or K+/H+ antiporter